MRSIYDDYNRLTGVAYDGADEPRFTYTYGNHGNISQVIDHERGVTVRAEYDLSGRPARKTISKAGESPSLDEHIYTGEVTYDTYGNVASFTEKAGETREAHTTTFTYDVENRPTELRYDGEVTLGYTYDALGRIIARTLTQAENDRTTSYTYVPGADENGTTTLVQSILQLGSTLTYTYDEVGSISSVSDGTAAVTYTYDTLGQLIRADDPHDPTAGETGTTWCYSYDLGGNILSKIAYAYTTGTVGPAVQTDTYTYGDANWKDKLTAFNGMAISYDAIGNPLNDGTRSYTWQHGRQLAGMSKLDGSQTVTFEYNEEGLRTKKTVNGVVTHYILHGSNLVHLTRGDDVLHFFYDAQNSPVALLYNGDWFAYVKNLQGDVIGITDAEGETVVAYSYDAWGKPIGVTGTMSGTLGVVNPFRYRGYVYDDETGLYYLRSRFYRPEWGRFVNADSLLGAYAKILNYDAFEYCTNSPVSAVDINGSAPKRFPLLNYVVNRPFYSALAAAFLAVKGWSVTNMLFQHSIWGNGEDYPTNDKNKAILQQAIANNAETKAHFAALASVMEPDTEKAIAGGLEYTSGDLHFSFQHISYSGVLRKDSAGKWSASIAVIDKFDFTEMRLDWSSVDAFVASISLSRVANDGGFALQEAGILIPFRINVEVEIHE